MKTLAELRASLHMVLARLDSEPKTAAEWEIDRSDQRKCTSAEG